MSDIKWDGLHGLPRYCPIYPQDRVVAWVFRNFSRDEAMNYSLLDLGCGAGRHAIFLAKQGYQVTACDYSKVGIQETDRRALADQLVVRTIVCEADNLPFPDNSFDGLLCYAVLYYLPFNRMVEAVNEIYRVLKPGGKALIVLRSNKDSRCCNAKNMGGGTYKILSLDSGAPSEAEVGMDMTFLGHKDIKRLFSEFSQLLIDRSSFTSNGGSFVDDDWFIYVVK
jgi:SAM-dependent methyltransferase